MKPPSFRSLLALNFLILFISGLQAGLGPFFSIYLKADLHWDPNQIGMALGVTNVAAMLNQIPSGLMIDSFKVKWLLLGLACLLFAMSCLVISQLPYFSIIIPAQFCIGLAIAVIPPGIAAITMGLVGRTEFPKRESINESLSHAGNMLLVLVAGLTAYFKGDIWIVYSYAIFALLGIFPLFFINGKEINHNIARELAPFKSGNTTKAVSIKKVLTLSANSVFLVSAFLFHLSTGAQLTLVGQLFVQNNPKLDSLFMAGSIILSHLTMIFVSLTLFFFVKKINRKPIVLIAFIFTFTRGILYAISHNSYFMLALQAVDGISAGIFGVMSVIIISELAANSGRFNFMLGLLVLCQGMAYAMSNASSGFIAKLYGYNAGFYTLASFAMLGFIIFWAFMPETLKKKFF